jgi:ribose transport system ATP-binding protein
VNLGQNYTLQSISAVVLGGAGIFGGRGSFLSVRWLAFYSSRKSPPRPAFSGLRTVWQYWLPGTLILAAAAMYSRTRSSDGAH